MLKTPKAVTKISPKAREIITLSNLALLGFNIDINDITSEQAYYIEYYGMRRRNMEEQARFKALFENLGKIFSK